MSMKKFLIVSAFVVFGFMFASSANAQMYQNYPGMYMNNGFNMPYSPYNNYGFNNQFIYGTNYQSPFASFSGSGYNYNYGFGYGYNINNPYIMYNQPFYGGSGMYGGNRGYLGFNLGGGLVF